MHSNSAAIGSSHLANYSGDCSNIGFRVSLYAMLSIGLVLFAILWGEEPLAVLAAIACVISATVIVQRTNRDRANSKVFTAFFGLTGAHAILGYWAARNSSDVIWIGTSAEQMYRQSVFVVSATLLVASFVYDITSSFSGSWVERFGQQLHISESRLLTVARMFTLLGALCVLYVILSAGFMPILADHPGQARYISDELGPAYRQYAYVMDKGRDLLACAVPLVLFGAIVRRRNLDWPIGIAGVVALGITLDRARLIALFAVLLLTILLCTGKMPGKVLAFLALLIASYYGSQMLFLNALGEHAGEGAIKGAVLSGFPEIRDLGWTMSLLHEQRFNGMTLVEPFALGYWTAEEFKEQYGLGNITARLIGVPRSETGGLRITLAGEGYVNFGAAGCLVIGVLLGLLCMYLLRLAAVTWTKPDLARGYLTAMGFSWVCFWLYLAGTESTGVLKNGLSFVVVMFVLSRIKRRASFGQEA